MLRRVVPRSRAARQRSRLAAGVRDLRGLTRSSIDPLEPTSKGRLDLSTGDHVRRSVVELDSSIRALRRAVARATAEGDVFRQLVTSRPGCTPPDGSDPVRGRTGPAILWSRGGASRCLCEEARCIASEPSSISDAVAGQSVADAQSGDTDT